MALTVNRTGDWCGYSGSKRTAVVTVDFDSSYSTGGESFVPGDVGMYTFSKVNIHPKNGFVFEYDYTNKTILVYTQGAAHAAGGAATLDDYAVTAGPGVTSGINISREASAGAATARWGPLKEIANTDNLSTLTGVRVECEGY